MVNGMSDIDADVRQTAHLTPWSRSLALTASALLALLILYRETLFSMVSIWNRSETYAHCFLIFPISGYLIWKKRQVLSSLSPQAYWPPLASLAVLGFGWLLGNVTGAAVVQQYALVAMIPVLIWALLGHRVASEIAFPLVFLLFSVPFGEFLLPTLIGITGDFAVGLLELTGMPVYREGNFFSIPSGDWSVVEACSGLRYLIASITLGSLFAYITYQSYLKRTLFILLSVIVPIFANGMRAFLIVMIAHLSDMKLAMGVDHYIYGWLFFGLVMAILFWLGSRWRDDFDEIVQATAPSHASPTPAGREWPMLAVAACGLLIASIWPTRAAYLKTAASPETPPPVLAAPNAVSPWQAVSEKTTQWAPHYAGAEVEKQVSYSDGNGSVALFIKYYRLVEEGRDLVNSQNVLVIQDDATWKMTEETPVKIRLGGREIGVMQGRVKSRDQELLTWRWNWISGRYTANQFMAKFLEAKSKIFGGATDEAGIILAVNVQDDVNQGQKSLQSFVDSMLPSIEETLRQASAGSSR